MCNTYIIVVMVFVTWLVAGIIKALADYAKSGKFSPRVLLAYGGMPSEHSAFVTSIATSIFLYEGLSALFLLSVGLAIITIRDVVSMRRSIDNLAKIVYKGKKLDGKLISHTPLEIVAGILLGIIVPVIIYLLL